MEHPIVTALLALLAIPAVTSGLTALVRKVADAGIPPRVTVYGVAVVVTGLIGFSGGLGPIPIGDDPAVLVGAWITWAGATGALAEAIYRTLQPILTPA